MPDQLTDRARKAAEEIQDYCDLSSHDCDRVAAIIERHWREHIESEKKLILSGKMLDGCNATGDCECHGKCYECDYFDDQHFVVRRGSMHEPKCSPRPAPPKGQGGMDVMLEMKALDAEKSGMEVCNNERIANGQARAYYEDSFFALADKYRALKEALA